MLLCNFKVFSSTSLLVPIKQLVLSSIGKVELGMLVPSVPHFGQLLIFCPLFFCNFYTPQYSLITLVNALEKSFCVCEGRLSVMLKLYYRILF